MRDKRNPEQILKERADAFNSFRFHWEVGDMVAGSAMPGRYGSVTHDLKTLQEKGIGVIVNLTHRTLEIPPEFEGAFDVIEVPIVDGHAPEEQQLDQVLQLVRDAVSRGKRTVIHCRGGIGRTATVLIPLIMELEGLPLEEAVQRVKKSGRFTQSTEQREFLKSWARKLPGA